MKKTILFTLLCLLSAAASVFAAPASEADFRKIEKAYILHADGSQEMRCTKELTLNTHLAFNSLYGETFIVYNPLYQTLKVHTAYTRQADGTRIEVPANAYNEVLPRAAADAPAYNHLREMVITHTGLELGATIYLDYSILTKPGYYPELDLDEVLQELDPVRQYTVSITVPDGKPLNYTLTGSAAKPAVTRQDGSTQYRWTLSNVPAASHAPLLPLDNPAVPRLSASTYTSGDVALKALRDRFDRALSPANQTWVKEFVKDKQNDGDKIAALHRYVLHNISTIPLPLRETGYRLRPNDEVFASAYGTAAEKTNLLLAILETAGFSPKLLVTCPAEHAEGLASVRELAVDCSGKYSATRRQTLLEQRGALDKILILSPYEVIPVKLSRSETINISSSDTLTAKEQAYADTHGYVVKNIALSSPDGVESWPGLSRLNSRRTDLLELPHLVTENYALTLTLPDGYVLETSPVDIRKDEPFASLEITLRPEGRTVKVARTLTLKQQQVSPADYPAFRTLINTWLSPAYNQVILRKE